MLTSSDLPAPGVLAAHGIDRVLYVVESLTGATVEDDDLHEAFLAYRHAGLAICIVDLDSLSFARPDQPSVEQQCEHPLYVEEERVTVVNDPSFYFRARRGFGGPRVIYGGSPGLGGPGHRRGWPCPPIPP